MDEHMRGNTSRFSKLPMGEDDVDCLVFDGGPWNGKVIPANEVKKDGMIVVDPEKAGVTWRYIYDGVRMICRGKITVGTINTVGWEDVDIDLGGDNADS